MIQKLERKKIWKKSSFNRFNKSFDRSFDRLSDGSSDKSGIMPCNGTVNLALRSRSAQFFSLTIFIIIIFMIVLFAVISNVVHDEERFNIDRLEKTVMNNYVSDFDQIYVEQIIGASLKPAIAGVLNKKELVTKEQLVDIMGYGGAEYMDPDLAIETTVKGFLGTATYSINKNDIDFTITLEEVDQSAPDELKFTFFVDYKFIMGDNVWERKDKEVIFYVDIYSLNHPAYNYTFIDNEWVVDENAIECFSNQVFRDAESCIGLNLKPPALTADT